MNGKSPMISTAPPFVPSINSGRALRFSTDERRAFQHNRSCSFSKRHEEDLSLRLRHYPQLSFRALRLAQDKLREKSFSNTSLLQYSITPVSYPGNSSCALAIPSRKMALSCNDSLPACIADASFSPVAYSLRNGKNITLCFSSAWL